MTDPQPWRSDLPVPDGPAVGVPGYLFEHAARLGDKPALVDGPTGRTLSYRQLAGAGASVLVTVPPFSGGGPGGGRQGRGRRGADLRRGRGRDPVRQPAR